MKYVLLIYAPEGSSPDPEMMAKHRVFAETMGRRGLLVAGEALTEAGLATTMKPAGDEMIITDGPYIETREHLGGFYIVECPDLDGAIDVARLLPLSPDGAVEIRAVPER